MAKADIMSILYSKEKSPLEFNFDSLWIPSLWCYLTPQDVEQLYKIATSIKYNSNIKLKYEMIDKILSNRGFKKFHCGTNRVVYSYLEDSRFLIKVALDRVGLKDNPDEYRNQFLLKPFVTKMFEVSPCGTVATVERVQPITSRKEFESIAGDIFELLNQKIIGKYILEDIGTKFFMNYGLRAGFGVCLLDYPYVYELDGKKLHCNKIESTGHICNGLIDYDAGFNKLECTKCGKHYLATELKQAIKDNTIILKEEGEIDMKIKVMRGTNTILEVDSSKESDVIRRDRRRNYNKEKEEEKFLNVSIVRNNIPIGISTVQEQVEDKKGSKSIEINLNNPKSFTNNNTVQEETKFKVQSTFIPDNSEIEGEVIIKRKDEENKEESKIDYNKALGLESEEVKQEESEEKKKCFGQYIYEDMDCMTCKDCSACSMEKSDREDRKRQNVKKRNIADEF